MRQWMLILLFLFTQVAYATKVDQIVVFGDSLSDNGNILSLTTRAHKIFPSVPITPKNPPYYEGRFSNGPVWIDNLALAMNVPLIDYAYGGAWAEPLHDSRIMVPFSIGAQVSYYLVRYALDSHKGDHLYIIWAGGNDYVMGREDPEYATTNTVANIETQIEWLTYYGAKNIMVMNLPNLSVVPEVRKMGPNAQQGVLKLVTLHNEKLAKMIALQKEKHPDAKIIYADVTKNFDDIYYHPEKYQIKDVENPCYGGDYSLRALLADSGIKAAKEQNIDIANSPSLRTAYITAKLVEGGAEACENPDQHMFWDQIHPTRLLHQMMAFDAGNILKANGIET